MEGKRYKSWYTLWLHTCIKFLLPDLDSYFTPNIYLQKPRYKYTRYINKPHHAHVLQRRFVSEETIKEKKGDGKPLQIGILQHSGTRVIDNLKDLVDPLQRALPENIITYSEFQYKKVKDQEEWFATKVVIIGAHGAAMTNSVFITPKAVVMQMYPPGTQ